MPLSAADWSEGQQQGPGQYNVGGGATVSGGATIYNQGNGGNATGAGAQVQGSDLAGNQVSTTTPSVNQGLYAHQINLANNLAADYQSQAGAAMNRGSVQIQNPNQGVTQAQLSGINAGQGKLQQGLAAVSAGQGPNVGQAVAQQGQDQSIAQALAAAHSRGGTAMGAIGAAQPGLGNAATAGAQARAQQIQGARGTLAGSLANQGQMNLQNYGQGDQTAMANAQLQEQQNAQNIAQSQGLYNASAAEQGAAATDLQTYNTGAINTVNAGTAHQQTQNNQYATDVGIGTTAAGTLL
jgi:hypothetical protein